jgi:hypothetical protein
MFNQTCRGQKSCSLNNFKELFQGEYEGKVKVFSGEEDLVNECSRAESRIFFQYMCKQTAEDLE